MKFSSEFDSASEFVVSVRSSFRTRTAPLISMEPSWRLEPTEEFFLDECGDHSGAIVTGNREAAEPWFGVILWVAQLQMVHADAEGDGTRRNYFVNTLH